MMDGILDQCRDSWTTWFPGEPTPSLSTVLMTRGRLSERAILMILPDRQPLPRLTVKIVWSGDAFDVVEEEAVTLRSIPRNFPGLPAEVPLHLATRRLSTGAALITTAVPGRRWRFRTQHWRHSPGVEAVLSRCANVMEATSCGATTSIDVHPLGSMAPLARWAAGLTSPGPQRKEFDLLAKALEDSDAGFRMRWQHGDLATGNILIGPHSTIGIVDWELAADSLPVWFDACYVACAAALELGPRNHLVHWIVRDALAPRWREPFPLPWGLSLTALISARRARTRNRPSQHTWLDVAAEMLQLPEATSGAVP